MDKKTKEKLEKLSKDLLNVIEEADEQEKLEEEKKLLKEHKPKKQLLKANDGVND
jgi:hypothetical protein